jgi:uncharacterized protein YjbI with pentapeptide repeats
MAAEFARVAFVSVDLTAVVNRRGVFTECHFRDCAFNASVHEDTAFVNSTFTRCRFFDTRFTRCKLVGAMFDRCSFELLECSGGDWSFVGMPGADLRAAVFRDLKMREADLTGVRFDGATLRGIDLSAAWLHRASFIRADLRGSDLTALDPVAAELGGAVVDPDQTVVLAANLGLDVRADLDPLV